MVLQALPQCLVRVPYAVGLGLLKLLLATYPLRLRCWARNSYVLRSMVLFKSDLDTTVILEDSSAAWNVAAWLQNKTRKLKKILPFLGEINFYVADEARAYASLANKFEIQRDPLLLRFVGFEEQKLASTEEAAVFWLRMIEGDLHNLVRPRFQRQNKWRRHAEDVKKMTHIELHLPDSGAPNALLQLCVQAMVLLGREKGESAGCLEAYLRSRQAGEPDHLLLARSNEKTQQLLLELFPHRFCYLDNYKTQSGADVRSGLTELQLCWEAWGLLSQFRFQSDNSAIIAHFQRLMRVVAVTPKLKQLLENLERLAKARYNLI